MTNKIWKISLGSSLSVIILAWLAGSARAEEPANVVPKTNKYEEVIIPLTIEDEKAQNKNISAPNPCAEVGAASPTPKPATMIFTYQPPKLTDAEYAKLSAEAEKFYREFRAIKLPAKSIIDQLASIPISFDIGKPEKMGSGGDLKNSDAKTPTRVIIGVLIRQ